MRRVFTFVVGLGVGVIATTSLAAAQEVVENPTVTSDGEYVVATDDEGGDNDVEGGGTDIVVGDVTTGNSNGEVLGDPSAIYYPDLSAVPSISGEPRTPTIVGLPIGNPNSGDLIPGIDVVFATEAVPVPATESAPVAESAPSAEDATAGEAAVAPVDDEAGVPIE